LTNDAWPFDWGVADYTNGVPMVEKQTWAARLWGISGSRRPMYTYHKPMCASATVGGPASKRCITNWILFAAAESQAVSDDVS
jgi:hypothetical protein